MRWRMIGPFRGGRTKAAAGVPSQPGVFYIGVDNGGVWKTTDYGRTWTPIFDDQPTGSIGAIARRAVRSRTSSTSAAAKACSGPTSRPATASTSPPTPARRGRTSACATGSRFRRSPSIRAIRIASSSPCSAIRTARTRSAASSARPTAARRSRRCSTRTRTPAASTSSSIRRTRDIVYAALWEARQGPWENGVFSGPDSGLFKSTDGGTTWRPARRTGCRRSSDGLGRIGIERRAERSEAPVRDRSSATRNRRPLSLRRRRRDAGSASNDRRARLRAAAATSPRCKVDPKNPDIVYAANIVDVEVDRRRQDVHGVPRRAGRRRLPPHLDQSRTTRRSSCIASRSGRDHHGQRRRDVELLVQPADRAVLPRHRRQRVPVPRLRRTAGERLGVRREPRRRRRRSRSATGIRSASRSTATSRPIRSIPTSSTAARSRATTAAPGRCRTSRRSRCAAPTTASCARSRSSSRRSIRTPVLRVEHPLEDDDRRRRAGRRSAPTSRAETWDVPANVGKYRGTPAAQATQRGVIYTVAPSPLDVNRIWAGTDDGLIHVTRDGGKTWNDVTPPAARRRGQGLDHRRVALRRDTALRRDQHASASTTCARTSTARATAARPGRRSPAASRTAPSSTPSARIRSARACSSPAPSTQVYVSFDDGDHWQSLRLNMPATSIRDLVIKDDDLVVGTHGRGVLDPRRHHAAAAARVALVADVHLFTPQRRCASAGT